MGLARAFIFLALLALIVYLVRVTSDSLLWISAVLWILFIGYWSAVAGSSAATKLSESTASRKLHQLLMYGALALEFVRLPGLPAGGGLPNASWVVLIGLGVHALWAFCRLGAGPLVVIGAGHYCKGRPPTGM